MRKLIQHFIEEKPKFQKQIEDFLKDNMDFKMKSKKHKIDQRAKVLLIHKEKSLFETEFGQGVTPFINTDCFEQLRQNSTTIKSAFERNNMSECFTNLEKTLKCLDELKRIEAPKINQIDVDKEKWIKLLSNFSECPEEVLRFYDIEHEIDRKNDVFGPLGTYNLSTHVVKLYIDAILDWAILIDIDPIIAYKLTFCHEMAHKFHHIGIDEEGRNWMRNYQMADDNICEGLTQWYSLKFAQEIDNNGYSGYTDKTGKILNAEAQFESESNRLSNIYKYYRNWKDYRFETIRVSMIHSRENGITVASDFDKVLDDYNTRSI